MEVIVEVDELSLEWERVARGKSLPTQELIDLTGCWLRLQQPRVRDFAAGYWGSLQKLLPESFEGLTVPWYKP
jgi:hypothetical protein